MSDGLRLISSAIAAGSSGTIMELDPELFVDDERPIYDFVRQHLRRYRELPQPGTVHEETGRRLPTANEPLDFYVDQLHERSEYEQIRVRFAPLREALAARDMEAAKAVIGELGRVTRARQRRGHEVVQMDEGLGLVLERIQATRGYGGITGIPSGWAGFDEITGGYQNSDIITWVARMAIGKTYLLLKQAAHAHAEGHSVLFVTTEMGQEQIARRYASIALGINPTILKTGMLSTYMERRLRGLYEGMIGAERFKIFSVGMNAKVSAVEAYMQEFGPDIVYVDGVILMRPSEMGRNMSRVDRLTGVYDDFKALNLASQRPFVLSSQLNRSAGKGGKDASLENLAQADAVGTHSSIVVAAKTGPTENIWHSRWLDFLKGREGESGKIAINFKFAPLDMNEFTPEEQEREGATPEESNLDWMR